MNTNYICSFDFETGGRNPHSCEILEIGACIVDPFNLEVVDKFYSRAKPYDMDALEDGALRVNNISKSDLEKLDNSYYPNIIWPLFESWVNQYNRSKTKLTPFWAPIPCGYNIMGYDMIILRRYCEKYGSWDKSRNDQKIFNQVFAVDLQQDMWLWFERCPDLKNLRLTTLTGWLGYNADETREAHNALNDALCCARIFGRFMSWRRRLMKRRGYLKNAFGTLEA